MIRAELICDSISPQGHRLRTFKTRYPWMIHGEVMTHRVFSRNASSNRAIPLKKMLEEARSDELRAEPVYWGAEQKGMEPGGELSRTEEAPGWADLSKYEAARIAWRDAALYAAERAEQLGRIGLHKSLCNRLLMPFTHANTIITATEFDNFFGLRLDSAADPTMRALAIAMWEAQAKSEPVLLQPGQWHLPFIERDGDGSDPFKWEHYDKWETAIRVSVARCARVSYESFETGKRSTVEEDLKLYDRLVGAQPLHASPAEHQATPLGEPTFNVYDKVWEEHKAQQGNLTGWRQYRKMLPGEAVALLPNGY